MVAADARKESLKKAEAELKADTAENDREKEEARQRTAADEKELSVLRCPGARNCAAGVSEDALRHYDHVLKVRGTALAAVYDNEVWSVQRHAASAGVPGGHDQRACS